MENIKESVKTLFSVQKDTDKVDKFAREAYYAKFKDIKREEGSYHGYTGFEIIAEDTIRVLFAYGAGDHEYTGFFDIKL
jgi:hypothetical protein